MAGEEPGGGTGLAGGSAQITIDTSQAEKAVPAMSEVASSIVNVLSKLDKSTKAVEQAMKAMANESATQLKKVAGEEARLTEISKAETSERREAAKQATADSAALARVFAAELIEIERRITADHNHQLDIRSKAFQGGIVNDQIMQRSNAALALELAEAHTDALAQQARRDLDIQQVLGREKIVETKKIALMEVEAQKAADRQILANVQHRNRLILQYNKQQRGGGGGMLGGILGSIGGGGGPLNMLAGIGGAMLGGGIANIIMQTVAALGQMAIAAANAATAFDRQEVAARSLAGSTRQLNTYMAVYDEATGGVLNKSTQLANVTKLMAVGFGDSAEELEQFAKVIRGISLAMGMDQDTVTQNLTLELFSQRGARLDQLGLQYDEVKAKAIQLMDADASLTRQQAYQNAVLDQAISRYGALAESQEGQASGVEALGASFGNLGTAIAQLLQGPMNNLAHDLNIIADAGIAAAEAMQGIPENKVRPSVAGGLNFAMYPGDEAVQGNLAGALQTQNLARQGMALAESQQVAFNMGQTVMSAEEIKANLADAAALLRAADISVASINASIMLEKGGSGGVYPREGGYPSDSGEITTADQEDAAIAWNERSLAIEANHQAALHAEQEAWAEKRSSTINDHEAQIFENAVEFNHKRQRDMQDHVQAVDKLEQESAQKEIDARLQMSENIVRLQRDAGRSAVREQREYNERIADTMAEFNRRRVQMEEDFAKDVADVEERAVERETKAREDVAKTVARMQRDAGRQAAREQREYNEKIADFNKDALKRTEDANDDHTERVVEANEESAERLAEIEKSFLKDREQAAEESRESILGAASRLDARAVYEEQRRFALESKQADEAHKEALDAEQKRLAEQLAEENEAHEERLADIAESLQEQIDDEKAAHAQRVSDANEALQQQIADTVAAGEEQIAEAAAADAKRLEDMKAAHAEQLEEQQSSLDLQIEKEAAAHAQRVSDAKEALDQQIADTITAGEAQIAEAKAADAQRLLDMQTAHEAQKKQEDLDYGLQLGRMKTHHTNQLSEINTEHQERIRQINRHAGDERTENDKNFRKQMEELGKHDTAQARETDNTYKRSMKAMEIFYAQEEKLRLEAMKAKLEVDKLDPSKTPEQIGLIDTAIGRVNDRITDPDTGIDAQIEKLQGELDALPKIGDLLKEGAPSAAGVFGAAGLDKERIMGRTGAAGMMGTPSSNITMGDISIVLGDIGNRSNEEVKTLVGEALLGFVQKAASYGTKLPW